MARYIDADEFLNAINNDNPKDLAFYISYYIATCSTADVVEHKRGKWKQKANYLWQGYECSHCKYEIASRTNFCPMCGADMRKEVELC